MRQVLKTVRACKHIETKQVIEELRTRGRLDRPQLGMRLVATDREGQLNGVMVSGEGSGRGDGVHLGLSVLAWWVVYFVL